MSKRHENSFATPTRGLVGVKTDEIKRLLEPHGIENYLPVPRGWRVIISNNHSTPRHVSYRFVPLGSELGLSLALIAKQLLSPDELKVIDAIQTLPDERTTGEKQIIAHYSQNRDLHR
ncbi:MAG: hypothetical protein PVJ09_05620 [Candidatus Woesebacteria bacterium]|jgi:hypothetical protein